MDEANALGILWNTYGFPGGDEAADQVANVFRSIEWGVDSESVAATLPALDFAAATSGRDMSAGRIRSTTNTVLANRIRDLHKLTAPDWR